MNKRLLWALVAVGGGYLLYKWVQNRRGSASMLPPIKPVAALPTGSKLTGRTQQTTNNRPPNYPQEAIGFGIRNWAEVRLADGRTDWVEAKS